MELSMSHELFRRFVTILHQKTGIVLKEYKKYLVVYRLSRLVGPDREFQNFEDFYEALVRGDETLTARFINALTTNYSFFFRDAIHFEIMAEYLKHRGPEQDYLRFWSAASSTGEEAYSMSITLLEQAGPLPVDRKILATDISTKVLDLACKGAFPPEHVVPHIRESLLKKYFSREKDNLLQVRELVKNLVSFRYLNLLSDFPFRKKMDLIFLRNVMIYLGDAERLQVLQKIYEHLKPGGLVFLGLSESLAGMRHPFVALRNSVLLKPSGDQGWTPNQIP